jgi:ketosteroid isomerase-like protein
MRVIGSIIAQHYNGGVMKRIQSLSLFCLLSVTLWAADPKTAAGVEAAEKAWATAIVKADGAAMEKVLADELLYVHSNGRTDTKRSYIDTIKAGTQKYERMDHHPGMKVKVYGDTAWVSARADVRAGMGTVSDVVLTFLHFWVYRDGRWQLAAHQSARVSE